MVYSHPVVAPQHNNNPGFKAVQYYAASKKLMDYRHIVPYGSNCL